MGDKTAIDLYSTYVLVPLTATVYRAKSSRNPFGYLRFGDLEDFIRFLGSQAERIHDNKESNYLLSPAIFDPEHPNRVNGKARGRENIRYLQHIWLDFENGRLSPEAIPDIFPEFRLIVTNTYNHTSESPRLRVIIPTTGQMTPAVYEVVWDNLIGRIKSKGYSVGEVGPANILPSSGVDVGKRGATSLFYAPCQAKHRQDSFFVDHNESGRHLLDPATVIRDSSTEVGDNIISFSRHLRSRKAINKYTI
jgi:hypothetical protein